MCSSPIWCNEATLLIHQGKLLDAVRVQNLLRFLQADPGATGDEVILGHDLTDAAVQAFIDSVTMTKANTAITAAQKKSIIDATAAAKVIPQCAMRVRRNAEVGPEASFVPDESCGCYWESKANGTAPASCKTCGGDGDCTGAPSTPTCRYGYCEAK
jgi:hypothetical protein